MNKTFHAFCTENGIHTENSAASTPEQNGRAERMNRTLIEKARTLLLGVEATEELWVDAVLTAAHLHNLMPVKGKNSKHHMRCFMVLLLMSHTLGSGDAWHTSSIPSIKPASWVHSPSLA
jgi:hypothetical protein